MVRQNITILKELQVYLIPLQKEEFRQLEKNIVEEGCREPLIVWPFKNRRYLIDGHNRYKICTRHKISFKISELKFDDIDDVKIWIINNQLGRRNLNPDQMSYYRGLKYENIKNKKGGYKNVLSKGQNELSTSLKIAREFNVSESTIKRDAKFARGVEFIGKRNPGLKQKIIAGDAIVNKNDINFLSDPGVQKKIRRITNEFQLKSDIAEIREQLIKDIEKDLVSLKDNKLKADTDAARSKEPVFLNKEDRIRQIKGKILSQLNNAIKEGNIKALDKLDTLIKDLKMLLNK